MGNSSQIILAGGGSYVFNITGSMKLDHAQILAPGLDPNEILYNLTGPKAATSGGLNDESVITGTLLVPFGDVSLTPGLVNGRILSGGSINIASGAAINSTPTVPDAGSTMLLLSIGLGCIATVKRKLTS
jgi:choice-of-anchor A domain-containing protein